MHYPTNPETREIEALSLGSVEKEASDRQFFALAELSLAVIRGVFRKELTEDEISCVVDDVAWFVTNTLDESFQPDVEVVATALQESVVQRPRSPAPIDKENKDTETLQEVSWITIGRIFDKQLSPDDAETVVDDVFSLIHSQFDESFQPDVEAVQRDITHFMTKKIEAMAKNNGGFTLRTLSAHQNGQANAQTEPTTQVGGRKIGEFLGFPN